MGTRVRDLASSRSARDPAAELVMNLGASPSLPTVFRRPTNLEVSLVTAVFCLPLLKELARRE